MTKPNPDDAVQVPPAGTYRFVPENSLVKFRTRHLFGLQKVVGELRLLDGRLVVADPPDTSAAQLTIDAGSFSSGDNTRDRTVRGPKWLDVAQFPTVVAKADSWRHDAQRWETTAEITAHGRTVGVRAVMTTAQVSGGTVRAHVTAVVDRYAFGITGMKGMAARALEMELELEAVREP